MTIWYDIIWLTVTSPLPQVSHLVDLKTFLQDPQNNPKNLSFKNQSERRKHIKEKMGLKIIRSPKDQSECVAVYDRTLMLSGQRTSASRIKEEQYSHAEKDAAKESFSKAQGGLMQPQRHTRVQDLVLVHYCSDMQRCQRRRKVRCYQVCYHWFTSNQTRSYHTQNQF